MECAVVYRQVDIWANRFPIVSTAVCSCSSLLFRASTWTCWIEVLITLSWISIMRCAMMTHTAVVRDDDSNSPSHTKPSRQRPKRGTLMLGWLGDWPVIDLVASSFMEKPNCQLGCSYCSYEDMGVRNRWCCVYTKLYYWLATGKAYKLKYPLIQFIRAGVKTAFYIHA